MFKFIKKIFKKKKANKQNKFEINPKVRAKAVSDNQKEKHVKAGDYCNSCDCHISECPYWNDKIIN